MPKKIPKGEGLGTLEGQRMVVGVEAWEGLGREGTPQTFTCKYSQHLRWARRLRELHLRGPSAQYWRGRANRDLGCSGIGAEAVLAPGAPGTTPGQHPHHPSPQNLSSKRDRKSVV